MNGKTHEVGGISLGALVASKLITPPYDSSKLLIISTFVAGSFVGSLLPDIDHKNSIISHKLKPISVIVTSTCSHRGITHAPIVNIVFYLGLLSLKSFISSPLRLLYSNLILGLLVGALSHILLDSLTVEGVPFFYPLNSKKYRLCKLRTGNHEELVKALIIMIALLIFVYT